MTDRIESMQLDVDELRRLRDDRDTLQDAIVSRDITIESLRQQVKELEEHVRELINWQNDAMHGEPVPLSEWQKMEAELAALKAGQGEPVEIPEYHYQGMGCGLEDRNITDRYEAMRYGWDEAIEQVFQHGSLYTSATTIPEGYVLVPVEPTDEMFEAVSPYYDGSTSKSPWEQFNESYACLIAAAPKPKDMP